MSISSINAVGYDGNQTSTTFKLIPLDQLRLHPDNVRQGHKTQDELTEMMASIKAHGLIHPLDCARLPNTTDHTLYGVVAGGMRYRALLVLDEAGELPSSLKAGIPCTICPEGTNYTEISMAENEIRAGMSVADQIITWSKLSQSGLSAEDIATRFGTTPSMVARRLKLTDLVPEVIDLHSNGQINYDTLAAFTLAPSAEAQRAYIEMTGEDDINAWSVRRHFRQGIYDGNSGIIKFIDRDAYFAAGGKVTQDLFAENDSDLMFSDIHIIHDLAMSRLNARKEELLADGWKWVQIALKNGDHDFTDTIHVYEDEAEPTAAEQERIDQLTDILERGDHDPYSEDDLKAFEEELDQIEGQISARDNWQDEQKACSGIFLSVSYSGDFDYKYRCRSEDVPDNDNADGGSTEPEDHDTGSQISTALKDDMGLLRTNIVQYHLLQDAEICNDILAYNLACSLSGFYSDASSIRIGSVNFATRDSDLPFAAAINDFKDQLDCNWQNHRTDSARFTAFRSLTNEAKADWVKFAVTASYSVHLQRETDSIKNSDDLVANSLSIDWCNIWRPGAAFWKRLRKPALRAILIPLLGEAWVNSHIDTKKTTLAQKLEDVFSGHAAALNDVQRTNALNWQVPGFGHHPAIQEVDVMSDPATAHPEIETDVDTVSTPELTIKKAAITPTRADDGSVQWVAEPIDTSQDDAKGSEDQLPDQDMDKSSNTALEQSASKPVADSTSNFGMTTMVFDSHLRPITPDHQPDESSTSSASDEALPAFLQ